jgi:putative ABC transport system permease protein
MRIENVAFQVVGVLHGEGKQIDGDDLSEMVMVPITAARAYLVRGPLPRQRALHRGSGQIGRRLHDAIEDIKETLRDRHRIKFEEPDDFRVENLATRSPRSPTRSAPASPPCSA